MTPPTTHSTPSGSFNHAWGEYLRIGQAKAICGMSKRLLRRLLEDGDIDGYRTPGGHWRISKDSLHNYIERDNKVALEIIRGLKL